MRQTACVVCLVATVTALRAEAQAPPKAAAERVAERLKDLTEQAAALNRQEGTILNELRKLELERQIKSEELSALDASLTSTREQLAAASTRTAALRQFADAQVPELETRLVRLYKMGRAGYWRLLLDVDDLQSMGRAYRTAAVLTRLDRDRVGQHEQTLRALDDERRTLEARATEVTAMQEKAAVAQLALDRAVASRSALVTSIEERKDLAAQFARELQAAHTRLQAAIAQPGGAGTALVLVPLRPFRGQMPWPADGIVTARFGRQPVGRMAGINVARNGIDLSLPEGRAVNAVHEGVVTFAGPFTAYGNLVIVDHGGGAQTLYGHLSSRNVEKGDRVGSGDPIGLSGRNPGGNPSLYFELRIDGQPVDPLQWLRKGP